MKSIKLTQNKEAIIDDEDFDWLNQYKWHAVKHKSGRFYAVRNIYPFNDYRKGIKIFMHKEIMETEKKVDWKNDNTLDNQKDNLFITTVAEISRIAHTGLKRKKHEKA